MIKQGCFRGCWAGLSQSQGRWQCMGGWEGTQQDSCPQGHPNHVVPHSVHKAGARRGSRGFWSDDIYLPCFPGGRINTCLPVVRNGFPGLFCFVGFLLYFFNSFSQPMSFLTSNSASSHPTAGVSCQLGHNQDTFLLKHTEMTEGMELELSSTTAPRREG